MSTIAFALRADVAKDFDGGSLNAGNGVAINIKDALDAGNGTIVLDEADSALVAQFDTYGALKRTAVPEGASAIRRYDFMDAAELNAEAARRGIKGIGSASKAALHAALIEQDGHIEAGDLTAANDVTAKASAAADPPKTKAKASADAATAGDAGSEA